MLCSGRASRADHVFSPIFAQTMYQGVLRDDARRLDKHRQREEALQESLRKRELYEKVQTVSSPAPLPSSSRLAGER